MSTLSMAFQKDPPPTSTSAPTKSTLLPPHSPLPVPTSSTTPSSALISPPSSYSASSPSPITLRSSSYHPSSHMPSPPSSFRAQHMFQTPPPSSSSSSSSSNSHSHSNSNSTTPLNTNSPLALAAAAAVTPEKLATLLLIQGPLPIRHITAHLALTVPGFGELSLSKQRRLIIAALDSVDPVNQIRFDKVGWGRWAAKKTNIVGSTSTSGDLGNGGLVSGAAVTAALTTRRRRESASSLSASAPVRPPLSPLLKPTIASTLAAAQATSVWAEDEESGTRTPIASTTNATSSTTPTSASFSGRGNLAHRRHRRRSSIHRSRMVFKDYDSDDDEEDSDEDDLAVEDDDEDEDDHDDDDDDYAVAGDLELEEDAVKPIPGSKHNPNSTTSVVTRRTSETDDEDWRSIGAVSLRHHSLGNTTSDLGAHVAPKSRPHSISSIINPPNTRLDLRMAAPPQQLMWKQPTSSLRNTPLSGPAQVALPSSSSLTSRGTGFANISSTTSNAGRRYSGPETGSLGGREQDAVAALFLLRSYV